MNAFVIGDVHGCFFTMKKLLEYWKSDEENLVFCGDLIDRGPYSASVVGHIRELQARHPHVHVLMGNHEQMATQYLDDNGSELWLYNGGKNTLLSYSSTRNAEFTDDLIWMKNLPGYLESDYILISHAGITEHPEAYDLSSDYGLLWNRQKLANLGKAQFHGHTPHKTQGPEYTKASNSWNLDTACVFGNGLCGVHISAHGELTGAEFIPTLSLDRV